MYVGGGALGPAQHHGKGSWCPLTWESGMSCEVRHGPATVRRALLSPCLVFVILRGSEQAVPASDRLPLAKNKINNKTPRASEPCQWREGAGSALRG